MHVPKGIIAREYTTALAPTSREAENAYLKKNSQVLAIRQKGEAWGKPFIAMFKPSIGEKSSIESVSPMIYNDKVVGVKVVSNVDKTFITDYIISHDDPTMIYLNDKLNLKFEGRYGIVRVQEGKGGKKMSLYI